MDLNTRLVELQKRASEHREILATEEAAKTALVMPFLQILGYDVFNPKEVVPEFTADVGTKRGEKVDYAIISGGKVSVLVECKPANSELTINHAGQLFRYFSVTEARLSILTNGLIYQFYTDSDQPNKMDQKPFFVFDLANFRQTDPKTLEKFQKNNFDIAQIVAEASSLKLKSTMRAEIMREFSEPSDEFVRFVASLVHAGMITRKVREDVSRLLPSTISEIIRDMVTERLSTALKASAPAPEPEPEIGTHGCDEIETTEEEIAGWRIVQAICAKYVDPKRVVTRDQKSYCAILLDDNNRKSVVRLHFNSQNKQIGTFTSKDETRNSIKSIEDIFKCAPQIEARIQELLGSAG